MLLKETEPFVRNAICGTLNKNSLSDIHTWLQAPDHRLFYIIKGKGKMTIEDNTYTLTPGCCILFQSGTRYIWHTDDEEGISYIAVNFDYTMNHAHITASFHPIHSVRFSEDDILERISFEDAAVLNTPIFLEDMTSAEQLRLMTTEFLLGNPYITEFLSASLKAVIISIVRMQSTRRIKVDSKNVDVVRRIIEYIQSNYDKDLKNQQIGEIFHFNPIYINRIFKEQTGCTIHRFLIQYRLKMAAELLLTEPLPINEICYMVGFRDVSHFTKSFKKHTEKAPAEYRKQMKY